MESWIVTARGARGSDLAFEVGPSCDNEETAVRRAAAYPPECEARVYYLSGEPGVSPELVDFC